MVFKSLDKLDNLFEDLEELDSEVDNIEVVQDIHADQLMWKEGSLNSQIDALKEKQEESIEFYNRRIESVNKQIDRRSYILEQWIRLKNSNSLGSVKTVSVPNGTVRLTTRTKRIFPSDETLISFCEKNGIANRKYTKPAPKKDIVNFIKDTGDAPDGYEEQEQQSFSYKVNKNG